MILFNQKMWFGLRFLGLCCVCVCVCVFLLPLPNCETSASHLSRSDKKKRLFQQGLPFIFSLPLQRGNQEPLCEHQKPLLHLGGLNRSTSPAFISCMQLVWSAQSDLWGLGGQRGCPWQSDIPSLTKVPVSCWRSQKERWEGLWGLTEQASATERSLDHQ